MTGLTENELAEIEQIITNNFIFINENIIPTKTILASKKLLIDIDLGDLPFVALTKQLNGKLWTGDKKLIEGLKSKNFNQVISTSDLNKLIK